MKADGRKAARKPSAQSPVANCAAASDAAAAAADDEGLYRLMFGANIGLRGKLEWNSTRFLRADRKRVDYDFGARLKLGSLSRATRVGVESIRSCASSMR
jgi:hypothetical protein